MAKYVVLINWTDQGVRSAKDTVNRSQQARSEFEAIGVKVESVLWTLGRHDLVVYFDAPDDATAAAAMLRLAAGGNVRTEIMRAFDESEMTALLAKTG